MSSNTLADWSLRLLAIVNLAFLAAAFCGVAMSVARAQDAPDPAACAGADLLAELARDDPGTLAQIRKEAASVENGDAMLWRIEVQGQAPSWLFGTMHVSDPRVTDLTPAAREAFGHSTTVVIETTDVLDQSRMMAAMAARPDLMMFTDETTLLSLVPQDERAGVEAALKARGIPLASVRKMKPWMLTAMIALPGCELARKAQGQPVLDVMLARQAEADGKRLLGLETVTDQLGAMASLPMDLHVRGMISTLRLGSRIEDVMETMVTIYLEGEPGLFWPFFRSVVPADGEDDQGYAAFEEAMITARNKTMAERARPMIEDGGAFIAVGALHLPGEQGLVALLRGQGLVVEPVR